MEKTHKRKLYKKMFKSNEVIPKTHGFIEGIKDLKVSELEKINKNIIKKAKENNKNRIHRRNKRAIFCKQMSSVELLKCIKKAIEYLKKKHNKCFR